MTRILSIVNQKGGVGKTTTAINLAAGLALAGRRTLLIDIDPQCNATGAVGCKPSAVHGLLSEPTSRPAPAPGSEPESQDDDEAQTPSTKPLPPGVLVSSVEGLDVMPGSRRLGDADALAAGDTELTKRFRTRLDEVARDYDFVLIDCPPSAGAITQTALTASTEVLIPIQCEYFAMVGVTQLITTIKKVITATDGRLTFGGIVLTMYDPALELTGEIDAEVREFFGDVVFDTVVPRDVSLCEAPSHGESIFQYEPRSRGAMAYTQLCMEVLQRD